MDLEVPGRQFSDKEFLSGINILIPKCSPWKKSMEPDMDNYFILQYIILQILILIDLKAKSK